MTGGRRSISEGVTSLVSSLGQAYDGRWCPGQHYPVGVAGVFE